MSPTELFHRRFIPEPGRVTIVATGALLLITINNTIRSG